jgi:hypothetical protein
LGCTTAEGGEFIQLPEKGSPLFVHNMRTAMSWDVFIQHLPASAVRVEDVPATFEPIPLGSRAEVLAALAKAFPAANTSDPTWITIDDPRYSIELSAAEDPVSALTLHVRGDESVIPLIDRFIDLRGARAVDTWTGEFFDPATAVESIRRWTLYLEEL